MPGARSAWSILFMTRISGNSPAPVGFELLFTLSAQTDAAFLPLEVGPAADEPRELVLDLRELDLQLALDAPRTHLEDVDNQAGAVDHPALELLLEIALLHAGE